MGYDLEDDGFRKGQMFLSSNITKLNRGEITKKDAENILNQAYKDMENLPQSTKKSVQYFINELEKEIEKESRPSAYSEDQIQELEEEIFEKEKNIEVYQNSVSLLNQKMLALKSSNPNYHMFKIRAKKNEDLAKKEIKEINELIKEYNKNVVSNKRKRLIAGHIGVLPIELQTKRQNGAEINKRNQQLFNRTWENQPKQGDKDGKIGLHRTWEKQPMVHRMQINQVLRGNGKKAGIKAGAKIKEIKFIANRNGKASFYDYNINPQPNLNYDLRNDQKEYSLLYNKQKKDMITARMERETPQDKMQRREDTHDLIIQEKLNELASKNARKRGKELDEYQRPFGKAYEKNIETDFIDNKDPRMYIDDRNVSRIRKPEAYTLNVEVNAGSRKKLGFTKDSNIKLKNL